jgi:hypothetical protein
MRDGRETIPWLSANRAICATNVAGWSGNVVQDARAVLDIQSVSEG